MVSKRRFQAPLVAFLVSLGVLLVEISLTRILSYTLWYHFAYVAIAVALLGYGASGAALASWERLARVPPERLIATASLLGAFSMVLMLLSIRWVPFLPLELTSDPSQLVWMTLYLLVVSLPFFAAGIVISSVLHHWREQTTLIYFADLVGGGIGCAAVVPTIWVVGAPGAVAVGASALGAAAVLMAPADRRIRVGAMAFVAVATAAVLAATIVYRPSPDKLLGSLMAKGSMPLFSRWSPIFRVDVYEGWKKPRLGTSTKFKGTFPQARYVTHDGGAAAAMYRFNGNPEELEFFDWNIAAAPYQILDAPRVLIIGLGGGFDVLAAIRGEASHITGVDLDPVTVDVVRNHSGDFAGRILDRPDVETVVAEGRSFLRHASEEYDLIQLTGVDTLAALSSGAYVLAESYLYTVEAMEDFLTHLSEHGMLSIMIPDLSWRAKRARFSLRHVGNFLEAAHDLGWSNPAEHVALISSRNGLPMLELMFKRSPFTPEELEALHRFVTSRGFEIWALPGVTSPSPHHKLINGSVDEREALWEAYPLEVRPTRDDRPFFFHFFRWGDLLGVSGREIDRGHTGATGQIVLGILLLFTIVASFVMILVPLLVSQRIALSTPGALRFAVYFAGVGLGFMLLEISLIQRFVLFLGHPTYAIATILATLLVSTGLGSFLSGYVDVPPRRLLLPALGLVALIALIYVFALPALFGAMLGAPLSARVALALVSLMPLGLTLGVFFPSGLRIVGEVNPTFIPWAWGVNGGASVVGSILAIVLAITYGFRAVTFGGLCVYAVCVTALLSTATRAKS